MKRERTVTFNNGNEDKVGQEKKKQQQPRTQTCVPLEISLQVLI